MYPICTLGMRKSSDNDHNLININNTTLKTERIYIFNDKTTLLS